MTDQASLELNKDDIHNRIVKYFVSTNNPLFVVDKGLQKIFPGIASDLHRNVLNHAGVII